MRKENSLACFSQNFKIEASICCRAGWIEPYLVANQEDEVSREEAQTGPEVIKLFSCSTCTKFRLLKKDKIPTNEDTSCLKSLRCCIYNANKY